MFLVQLALIFGSRVGGISCNPDGRADHQSVASHIVDSILLGNRALARFHQDGKLEHEVHFFIVLDRGGEGNAIWALADVGKGQRESQMSLELWPSSVQLHADIGGLSDIAGRISCLSKSLAVNATMAVGSRLQGQQPSESHALAMSGSQ